MNPKPTRNFIILWTLLIAVFLGGLIVAFILAQQNSDPQPQDFTRTYQIPVNETVVVLLHQTQTAAAARPSPTLTLPPYTANDSPTAPFLPSPTQTLPPYDASMSPTALPPPAQLTDWAASMTARALTPSPTLCPYSDVICPGGNATLSPAQQVMVLMASASAPEFGQLAQTATAYAVSPTPTPAVHDSNCVFNWARQDLPDVTNIVQTALNDAGIAFVTARAEAYGENCIRQDQTISYFAAMTTDFYLTIPLNSLADEERLGQVVAATYAMLTAIPEESLPARLGYLDITFAAGEQAKRFRAMFDQLRPLVEAGESGAALLKAGAR